MGASYVTARDPRFQAVVADWVERGLARPWTDTFHVATPEGLQGTRTGPMRYAAPAGLRSLVEDLAGRLAPEYPSEVDVVEHDPATGALPVDGAEVAAVALCMPGPQALDLLPDHLADERAAADRTWEPVLALVGALARQRAWPALDGVFVNDSAGAHLRGRRRPPPRRRRAGARRPLRPGAGRRAPRRPARRGPGRCSPSCAPRWAITSPPDAWDVRRWSLAKPLASRDGRSTWARPASGSPATAGTARAGSRRRTCPGMALGEALAARLTR